MLKEFLSQVRDQVSANIKKSIGETNPIEIAMSYSALSESKMIRAGLIFASGKINEGISNNSLITLASAIELIHTYSLIHDDLPCMDDDDFRRGKESCHIKFGEANAVLAGDALQTLAYEMVCNDIDLDPNEKINAIKFKKWIPSDKLIRGPFGTMEPKKTQISVFPQILVVPLLSFDRDFYRLGYGGGYYDKSISDLKKHFKKEKKFFITIGLAYSNQEERKIPRE